VIRPETRKIDRLSAPRARTERPPPLSALPALIKNIKFSSYIRKFRMEQLQSHI
jgi:hypothetical protein